MSYEVWGDDDDGSDTRRDHLIDQLLKDGWLDEDAAMELRRERDELAARCAVMAGALTCVYADGWLPSADGRAVLVAHGWHPDWAYPSATAFVKEMVERALSALPAAALRCRRIVEAYEELIYAVESKFPNETRNQTALRYIKERETRAQGPSQDVRIVPEVDQP